MTYVSNVTPIRPQPTICAHCGQAGHAANLCPDRPCAVCGKPGHHATTCPDLPGHAMPAELLRAA